MLGYFLSRWKNPFRLGPEANSRLASGRPVDLSNILVHMDLYAPGGISPRRHTGCIVL
jgi:hypothetical protein